MVMRNLIRRGPRRWLGRAALLASVALAPLGGCTCGETSPAPAPPTTAPTVPAPEGLVAELTLRAPTSFLTELRRAMAGPMLLLPKSVGGMVVNLFGLPITATDIIDERLPLLGASLVTGDGDQAVLHTAFAIHVKEGRRMVAHLSTGPDATFEARADGDFTWLSPKPALRQARLDVVLAVVDNYLVAGDDETAVRQLGPYMARTLARAEPPEQDILLTLKGETNVERLRARLSRLRAPLEALEVPASLRAFANPRILFERGLALLDVVGAGRVTVDLDPERDLVLEAHLEARDAASRIVLASLPTVEPQNMTSLPEGTVGALAWAEPVTGRAEEAAQTAAQVREAVGAMTVEDDEALTEALVATAEGRGAKTLVALRCTGVGLTGLVEGDVADGERLADGVEALAALRRRKSFSDKLAGDRMRVTVSEGRVRHVPHDVHLVRLERIAEGETELEPVDLRYVIAPERYYAAAGMESLETLQLLYAPDPERQWSQKPRLRGAIERLSARAWLSLLIEPHGLNACLRGKPGGRFATPASLSVGPADGGAELRLELASGLLKVVGSELF